MTLVLKGITTQYCKYLPSIRLLYIHPFIAFNRKCYQLPQSTLEVWNKYEPRSPSALYFVDSVSGGVFMQCLEIVRCPAGLWWWWASHHKMLVRYYLTEVIMKRVKTILLAGSDESTTIQQLWTSTKCNKNALTSQQSEHFWLLCNILGCSVQDILAPDISHSRLSKVDGMGFALGTRLTTCVGKYTDMISNQ